MTAERRPIELAAAAGGRGGSWYVLLEGLARLVRDVHPAITITVVEGGGVANHALAGSGRLPMAILNPPMIAAALAGRSPFERVYADLRVGVANLTVNHLQLAVAAKVPFRSLEEWPRERWPLRIPVDRIGTVDRLVFDSALAHLGLSEAAIERLGGRLVPASNYDEQLALFERQAVDALWQFMGIPSPSIEAAQAARSVRLLPLPRDLIAELENLGWTADEVPRGAYGAVKEPVATVSMGTHLGFHAAVPEEIVFAITSAICDNPERVRDIHPAAQHFDPTKAHLTAAGTLHPGAARYFSERAR